MSLALLDEILLKTLPFANNPSQGIYKFADNLRHLRRIKNKDIQVGLVGRSIVWKEQCLTS